MAAVLLSLPRPLPESSPPTPPSDASRRRRDLRSITADGACFSVMVGLGEAYVPAFALAIGLGDVMAGLVATVPMLLGACLQLVTPLGVRRLGSYRRWVVACAVIQALSFLPLAVGAWLGRVSVLWVALATVVYWGAGMATGPAWNAWVTSLVPPGLRELFFARRTRVAQASLLVALVGAGFVLEWGRDRGAELGVFATLFACALVARLFSARFLAAQSERPDAARRHRMLGPVGVWRSLRGADSLRVLRYLLAMQLAAHVAAPFFTPYMFQQLDLSYGQFMTLTAAAFVSRVMVLPLLGRLAKGSGAGRLLWLGGLGIVPLPALWLVSDSFGYLLLVQLLAGCAWAAVELATTLAYFEGIDEGDRASVLTLFNLANALAIALGSLAGAWILATFDASPRAYAWLFVVSTGARLLAAGLLRATPAPHGGVPEVSLRTLAVRPLGGTVQRPILASLPDPDPEPESSAPEGDAPRPDGGS